MPCTFDERLRASFDPLQDRRHRQIIVVIQLLRKGYKDLDPQMNGETRRSNPMGIHVAHEQDRYLEELYAAVQRSAEVGVKLVNQFCAFYSTIALGAPVVSAGPLEEFIEDRLKRYRNLLHDGMLAMPKDVRGRRVMPLPPAVRELPADRGLAADGTSFVKWSRRERPES